MRLRNTESAFDDYQKNAIITDNVRGLRWGSWPYRKLWCQLNSYGALLLYRPTGQILALGYKREFQFESLAEPVGWYGGTNLRLLSPVRWYTYYGRIQKRARKSYGRYACV